MLWVPIAGLRVGRARVRESQALSPGAHLELESNSKQRGKLETESSWGSYSDLFVISCRRQTVEGVVGFV